MAGEIEEPFRFNFQADLHSGSVSFGRFEPESLSWERRSIFSHNRYLEEVEKYSKPGSVTEKKAYFEAHFRRKALLKQSSECQDGRELQTSENDDAHGLEESQTGNENTHFTDFDESLHSSVPLGYEEETKDQKLQKENVEVLDSLKESDNVKENMHFAYFDEDSYNSVASEYDEETDIQKPKKENVEVPYIENGNWSRRVAYYEKSPHSFTYYEESELQDCERQNCQLFSVAPQDEPDINMVGYPVIVPEHVKLDEAHRSEMEKVIRANTEESKMNLTAEQLDVASEANDSSLTCHAAEKDDDSVNSAPQRMFYPKVMPALGRKPTVPELKAQASAARFQKTISSEAPNSSVKPRISVSDRKKTEKTSPRPASPFTHSEDSSRSFSKAKVLHVKESIVKELRSEKAAKAWSSVSVKPLLGVHQTTNRLITVYKAPLPKQIVIPSMSNQRSESRKEEKAAVKMKQSCKSLNFKATPLPLFYSEAARASDRYKVMPTSKTPNLLRTPPHPMASHSNKYASHSSMPLNTRPRSSTSSFTRTRPPEPRPSSSTSSTARTRPSETRSSSSTTRTRSSEPRLSSSTTRIRPSETRSSSLTTRTRSSELRPSSSTTRVRSSEPRPRSSTTRNCPSEPGLSSSRTRTRPSEPRPSSSTTRARPSEPRPSSSTTRARASEPRPNSTIRTRLPEPRPNSTTRTRPPEPRPNSTTRTRPSEFRPSSTTRTCPSEPRPTSSYTRTRPPEASRSSSTTRTHTSEPRPSSSTARTRPPEAVRKNHIPEKKEAAAMNEPRARDMPEKEVIAVCKSGYSAVGVVF